MNPDIYPLFRSGIGDFCFFREISMKIRLNGDDYDTEAATLRQLLDELHVTVERVAVELNMSIVRRADLADTAIKENDAVEIIQFVGGG